MKKFIYLFIWFPFISFSQDIIIKSNGDEISSKVIEITEDYIKYKEFDFQDGPLRNIKTAEVFIILYQNGKREKFTTLKSQTSKIVNHGEVTPNSEVTSNSEVIPNEVISAKFSKKKKIFKGSFKNLKEIKSYDVIFDYTGVTIPGFDSEEDFLADKMSKREEKKAGTGEIFKASWMNDRENKYHPEFIQTFNLYARKIGIMVSENSDERYVIYIHTQMIYPGYNVGVSSNSSYIISELSIYDKENPNDLLLKISYGKSYGNSTFNAGDRIAACYNSLAKNLVWDIKKKAFK